VTRDAALARVRRRVGGRTAAGASVAVVAAGALLTTPGRTLAALSWLASDPLRFGVALAAVAAVRPLLAWPTTLLAVAAGYAYGPAGAPLALALVVASSVPTFLAARRLGRGGRVGDAAARIAGATGPLRGVTASRLVPAPSDVVSAGAGVAGVGLRPFVVGTAVGEVPWVVAGVALGASLDRLDPGSLSAAVNPRLVLVGAALAALLLAGPAYRAARAAWRRAT
jgi:uncharacterized membrane protein YdjX (TVP38/TMEM64 family)